MSCPLQCFGTLLTSYALNSQFSYSTLFVCPFIKIYFGLEECQIDRLTNVLTTVYRGVEGILVVRVWLLISRPNELVVPDKKVIALNLLALYFFIVKNVPASHRAPTPRGSNFCSSLIPDNHDWFTFSTFLTTSSTCKLIGGTKNIVYRKLSLLCLEIWFSFRYLKSRVSNKVAIKILHWTRKKYYK